MEAIMELEVAMPVTGGLEEKCAMSAINNEQTSRDGDFYSLMLDPRMSHVAHATGLGIRPKPHAGAENPAQASAAELYMGTVRLQRGREGNYRN